MQLPYSHQMITNVYKMYTKCIQNVYKMYAYIHTKYNLKKLQMKSYRQKTDLSFVWVRQQAYTAYTWIIYSEYKISIL